MPSSSNMHTIGVITSQHDITEDLCSPLKLFEVLRT